LRQRGASFSFNIQPAATIRMIQFSAVLYLMVEEPMDNDNDLEDLSIVDATDPSLGLTDIGDVPADDWAADTGPTQSDEAAPHGVSDEPVDQGVSEDGHRIEFDRRRGK
jgi:hypothetical protein